MTLFPSRVYALYAVAFFLLLEFSPAPAGAKPPEAQEKQCGQSAEQSKPGDQQGEQEKSTDDITAVPNRPTFASTAEMVRLGVFEIEYGLEAASGHQNINGLLKWS